MNKPSRLHFAFLSMLLLVFAPLLLAKGPSTSVTVSSADPDSALQGESLSVRVHGEGFDAGSAVRFLVSGTRDDRQIVVNAVTFDPADASLVADIQVLQDAAVFDYDIEVRSSSGRRGKGTSLFKVQSGTSTNTGGFGDEGNGCVAFENPAEPGTIHDDARGAYCNGTDGQVSVPKRLRLDTKKFNREDRSYWAEGICHGGETPDESLCSGPVTVDVVQTQMEYAWIDGLLVPTDELDLQAMNVGQASRVSTAMELGFKRQLRFGNEHGVRVSCPAGSQGAPLWIQCEGDINSDGFCDLWTLTTSNLDGSSEPGARACLMKDSRMLDSAVQADFTLDVCVLGISCP